LRGIAPFNVSIPANGTIDLGMQWSFNSWENDVEYSDPIFDLNSSTVHTCYAINAGEACGGVTIGQESVRFNLYAGEYVQSNGQVAVNVNNYCSRNTFLMSVEYSGETPAHDLAGLPYYLYQVNNATSSTSINIEGSTNTFVVATPRAYNFFLVTGCAVILPLLFARPARVARRQAMLGAGCAGLAWLTCRFVCIISSSILVILLYGLGVAWILQNSPPRPRRRLSPEDKSLKHFTEGTLAVFLGCIVLLLLFASWILAILAVFWILAFKLAADITHFSLGFSDLVEPTSPQTSPAG
jgi:hypothetical protein